MINKETKKFIEDFKQEVVAFCDGLRTDKDFQLIKAKRLKKVNK